MITRFDHRGVQWVDVERPTIEEIEGLVDEFGLGPFVEQELLSPTAKPRIDLFPSFLYLVLHFPAFRDTHGVLATHEVDLIIAKDVVITVHYESVAAILDFSRSFETSMLLKRSNVALHSGHILFELSTRLYKSVEDELDSVEDSVAGIEKEIFNNREKEMVKPISLLTREVLNHKRIISGQDEVLREFETAGTALFGENFKGYISSMSALQFRVSGRVQTLLDTLAALRDTNNSLLTTKQNETVKNLTIVASVLLPMSLVTGLFGMNTNNNPIEGNPLDFWIVVGIIFVFGILTYIFFRLRNWF